MDDVGEKCGNVGIIICGWLATSATYYVFSLLLMDGAAAVLYPSWAWIWYCVLGLCVFPLCMKVGDDSDAIKLPCAFLTMVMIGGGFWLSIGSHFSEELAWMQSGEYYTNVNPSVDPNTLFPRTRTMTFVDTAFIDGDTFGFAKKSSGGWECYAPILNSVDLEPDGNFTGPMFFWVMEEDCCKKGKDFKKCNFATDTIKPTMAWRGAWLTYSDSVQSLLRRIRNFQEELVGTDSLKVLKYNVNISEKHREDMISVYQVWFTFFALPICVLTAAIFACFCAGAVKS